MTVAGRIFSAPPTRSDPSHETPPPERRRIDSSPGKDVTQATHIELNRRRITASGRTTDKQTVRPGNVLIGGYKVLIDRKQRSFYFCFSLLLHSLSLCSSRTVLYRLASVACLSISPHPIPFKIVSLSHASRQTRLVPVLSHNPSPPDNETEPQSDQHQSPEP